MAANGTVRGKAVMVVGATGALGSKTCRALLDQDVGVRALVRASSNREPLKALGVSDFVIGDMMDPASLAAAFSQHTCPMRLLPALLDTRDVPKATPPIRTAGATKIW